jgi:hypothetical protein
LFFCAFSKKRGKETREHRTSQQNIPRAERKRADAREARQNKGGRAAETRNRSAAFSSPPSLSLKAKKRRRRTFFLKKKSSPRASQTIRDSGHRQKQAELKSGPS